MKERQSGTDTVVRVRWSDSPYWHLGYDGECMEDEVKPLKPKSVSNGKAVEHMPVEKEMRPTKRDQEIIVQMRSKGACANSIASALGVCVRTYHNYVGRLGLREI